MNSPQLNDKVQRARAATLSGRLEEAQGLCDAILAEMPGNEMAKTLLAAVSYQRGQALEAIDVWKGVVARQPQCYDAYYWLSLALRSVHRYQECVTVGREMADKWPKSSDAYLAIGLASLAMHRYGDAQSAFEKAIELAPKLPILHYNLSIVLMQQGRYAEAEQEARTAVELGAATSAPYLHLAELLTTMNRLGEALPYFRKAHEVAPESYDGRLALVRALAFEGAIEEAAGHLREMIAVWPADGHLESRLGALYKTMGRMDEARAAFSKAIELSPDRVVAHVELAAITKFTDSDEGLVQAMQQLVEKPGLSEEAKASLHYGLGKAYDDTRRFEAAMKEYDIANGIWLRIRVGGYDPEYQAARTQKIVETFIPGLFEANRSVASDSDVPIFIVGMIRSGTTLTEQILSSHPEVSAAGELSYWRRDGRDVLLDPWQSGPEWLEKIKAEYLSILNARRDGKRFVTDKQPLNYTALGQIHAMFPNARIINCVRHPVDNCISIYATPFRGGIDFGHDRATIVDAYRNYRQLMDHFHKVIPADRLMDVCYDDLVMDPEATTRRLLDFCGLEWNDACLSHEANVRDVTTPSKWQVRQPIYRTSLERWRNYGPWLGVFAELLTPDERASLAD